MYPIGRIREIAAVARKHGLRMHLDGARVFNALAVTGDDPKEYGHLFNTISVCLSKGLGAPVGSVLLGSKADIHQAIRVRKMIGGGMRQAGFLAAAGIYALDHHVERLPEDHSRAKVLGAVLEAANWVEEMYPVDTNIVAFRPNPAMISAPDLVARLKESEIRVSTFDGGFVRMVTHLDFTDEMLDTVVKVLERI